MASEIDAPALQANTSTERSDDEQNDDADIISLADLAVRAFVHDVRTAVRAGRKVDVRLPGFGDADADTNDGSVGPSLSEKRPSLPSLSAVDAATLRALGRDEARSALAQEAADLAARPWLYASVAGSVAVHPPSSLAAVAGRERARARLVDLFGPELGQTPETVGTSYHLPDPLRRRRERRAADRQLGGPAYYDVPSSSRASALTRVLPAWGYKTDLKFSVVPRFGGAGKEERVAAGMAAAATERPRRPPTAGGSPNAGSGGGTKAAPLSTAPASPLNSSSDGTLAGQAAAAVAAAGVRRPPASSPGAEESTSAPALFPPSPAATPVPSASTPARPRFPSEDGISLPDDAAAETDDDGDGWSDVTIEADARSVRSAPGALGGWRRRADGDGEDDKDDDGDDDNGAVEWDDDYDDDDNNGGVISNKENDGKRADHDEDAKSTGGSTSSSSSSTSSSSSLWDDVELDPASCVLLVPAADPVNVSSSLALPARPHRSASAPPSQRASAGVHHTTRPPTPGVPSQVPASAYAAWAKREAGFIRTLARQRFLSDLEACRRAREALLASRRAGTEPDPTASVRRRSAPGVRIHPPAEAHASLSDAELFRLLLTRAKQRRGTRQGGRYDVASAQRAVERRTHGGLRFGPGLKTAAAAAASAAKPSARTTASRSPSPAPPSVTPRADLVRARIRMKAIIRAMEAAEAEEALGRSLALAGRVASPTNADPYVRRTKSRRGRQPTRWAAAAGTEAFAQAAAEKNPRRKSAAGGPGWYASQLHQAVGGGGGRRSPSPSHSSRSPSAHAPATLAETYPDSLPPSQRRIPLAADVGKTTGRERIVVVARPGLPPRRVVVPFTAPAAPVVVEADSTGPGPADYRAEDPELLYRVGTHRRPPSVSLGSMTGRDDRERAAATSARARAMAAAEDAAIVAAAFGWDGGAAVTSGPAAALSARAVACEGDVLDLDIDRAYDRPGRPKHLPAHTFARAESGRGGGNAELERRGWGVLGDADLPQPWEEWGGEVAVVSRSRGRSAAGAGGAGNVGEATARKAYDVHLVEAVDRQIARAARRLDADAQALEATRRAAVVADAVMYASAARSEAAVLEADRDVGRAALERSRGRAAAQERSSSTAGGLAAPPLPSSSSSAASASATIAFEEALAEVDRILGASASASASARPPRAGGAGRGASRPRSRAGSLAGGGGVGVVGAAAVVAAPSSVYSVGSTVSAGAAVPSRYTSGGAAVAGEGGGGRADGVAAVPSLYAGALAPDPVKNPYA
jgi:hypothetical protein